MKEEVRLTLVQKKKIKNKKKDKICVEGYS